MGQIMFSLDRMEDIYDRTNGRTSDPHRHEHYTVVWVKKASGKHIVDFDSHILEDDQIYFLSPGQVHQIITESRPEGCVLNFSREFLAANNIPETFVIRSNLFRPYGKALPMRLDPTLAGRVRSIFDLLYELFGSDKEQHDPAIAGGLLRAFLLLAHENCTLPVQKETMEQGTHLLERFRFLVEDNFNSEHKVTWYAGELFITPKHLNAVVRQLLGQTAKEYIQDRIIIEAKRLLLHTEMSVKEISHQLGYQDPLYFSRFFKNCTDLAPSEFRSSHNP
jgi:AraC-like DNA-binding protein